MSDKIQLPYFMYMFIKEHYTHDGEEVVAKTWDRADFLRASDDYIRLNGGTKVQAWLSNPTNYLSFVQAVATDNYEQIPTKFYYRKSAEHLAEFEDVSMSYLQRNKKTGKLGLGCKIGETNGFWEGSFTVKDATELLGNDYKLFEAIGGVED